MSCPFVGPIFEILAGPHHTSFLAHASILEKSETLRSVVQGRWKDSVERKIMLEEWDPETVSRLLEWLYTGDYESPYPAEAPRSDAGLPGCFPETSMPYNPDVRGIPPVIPQSESPKSSRRPLTPIANISFNKADPEVKSSNAEAFKQWAAKSSKKLCVLDFEAALLTHAKLYALADYMLLPTLQAQVFQRLKALLVFISAPHTLSYLSFPSPSEPIANTPVIGNILTLVRYVYGNTIGLESEKEPLRNLISTFIALHYDQFDDEGGEVVRFMEQGGDFQADLHDKLRRNEMALKAEVQALKKKLREAHKEITELQKPKW